MFEEVTHKNESKKNLTGILIRKYYKNIAKQFP